MGVRMQEPGSSELLGMWPLPSAASWATSMELEQELELSQVQVWSLLQGETHLCSLYQSPGGNQVPSDLVHFADTPWTGTLRDCKCRVWRRGTGKRNKANELQASVLLGKPGGKKKKKVKTPQEKKKTRKRTGEWRKKRG